MGEGRKNFTRRLIQLYCVHLPCIYPEILSIEAIGRKTKRMRDERDKNAESNVDL